MKLRSVRAFTLIELLIVLSLLLTLLTLIMMSINTLSSSWKKTVERQHTTFHTLRAIELFSNAVDAITPAYVRDKKGNLGFYFLGRDEGFTAVTENAIYNAGELAVIRVFTERQPDGTLILFYEEAPLNDYPLVMLDQVHQFNFRLPIAKNLKSVRFKYFGWESYRTFLDSDITAGNRDTPQWWGEYDGFNRNMQPEIVEISVDDYPWRFNMPTEKATYLQKRDETEPSY